LGFFCGFSAFSLYLREMIPQKRGVVVLHLDKGCLREGSMHHPISLLASQPVVAVDADSTAMEALRLMSAKRISRIVVLENAEPVGILTEQDVAFAANWVVGQPSLRIREVLSKPVLTAPAALTVGEACQMFQENDVRHLIVLDARMEMAGILTPTDLARALKSTIYSDIPDVATLMFRNVLRVPPAVSARHTLALMASHALSGVVVVESERPIGVFTEHDAIRLVSAGSDLASVSVGAVMTTPVVKILATDSPVRAVDLMQDHAVRQLMVVDDQGALVGILTQTGLGRVLEYRESIAIDGGADIYSEAGLDDSVTLH
jgi:CBS domain-containing protein